MEIIRGVELDCSAMQKQILQFIDTYYPEENNNFDIVVKPANVIDLDSEFIKSVCLDFRLSYHSDRFDSTSKAKSSVKLLAILLKQEEIVKRLEKISSGKIKGLSVARIEYTLLKSLRSVNVSATKNKFRINGKLYSLGSLNEMLLEAKEDIYLCFGELQSTFNIKEPDWTKSLNAGSKVGFDELGLNE